MTVTIQLSPEQSTLLAREANRRGVADDALATEWLSRCLSELARHEQGWTGATAVAYWDEQKIPVLFAGGDDSPDVARKLRSDAERRDRS